MGALEGLGILLGVVLLGLLAFFATAFGLTAIENVLALAIHEGVVGITALFVPVLYMFGSVVLWGVFGLIIVFITND